MPKRLPDKGSASEDLSQMDTNNAEAHRREAHLRAPAAAMIPPSAPATTAYGDRRPPFPKVAAMINSVNLLLLLWHIENDVRLPHVQQQE